MKLTQLDEDYPLTETQIARYRNDGFIKLEEIFTGEALQAFRDAVAAAVAAEKDAEAYPNERRSGVYEPLFIQRVNLWQRHPAVRPFTLCPRLANIAARLTGAPVRLWHDQALFKEPGKGKRTPWHQDAPYWPHQDRGRQVSVWLALRDATTENGCMSFLPGTHRLGAREAIELRDPKGVLEVAPEAAGIKPVTHELTAGSATFHHGLCFHYAGPNRSAAVREAFVVIYMPDGTRYDGRGYSLTDGRGLEVGDLLDGETFPGVSTMGSHRDDVARGSRDDRGSLQKTPC